MTRSRLVVPFAFAAAVLFAAPALSVAQTAKTASSTAAQIDINSASKSELMSLSNVDGASADRIINGRPFTRKHQLVSRKIVSRAVYDQIKDQIVAKQAKR